MKQLKIPFKAPLHEMDTEDQTFGCRANNPDICKNNGIDGICAFTRTDCICKIPSKAWKRQYLKMKQEQQ